VWLAVPAALAGLAFGGWWAANSSYFDAHHIGVSGQHHLTRAQIVRAAGIVPSTNVLWADTSAIASAVEANPWVASATVTRSLPSTLRIEVTERRAASTVAVGSTWFLVAVDGTVLAPARHRPHLPVLPSVGAVTVGLRSPGLAEPAAVAGAMTPELRDHVVTVRPGPGGAVQMGLDDGVHVLFGPATDVRAKDQALAGILAWARERHSRLATIDVRSPVAPSAIPLSADTTPTVVDQGYPAPTR